MHSENGFTLVEAIVSILLVGIIAAIAGMGIVSIMKGYVFTRENVVISQKARLAMSRITRELMALSDIDSANSTGTCIIYKIDTKSPYYRAMDGSSGNLELKISPATDCSCNSAGNILADRVGGFLLQYEDQNGNLSSTPPADLANLYAIQVILTLNRDDGNPAGTFSITVNPRNNGNLNGPGFSL